MQSLFVAPQASTLRKGSEREVSTNATHLLPETGQSDALEKASPIIVILSRSESVRTVASRVQIILVVLTWNHSRGVHESTDW